MLEKGTSGLMSGEGKRVGMQSGVGSAPFLDSTPSFALPHGENVLSKAFCKAEAMIASRLALPGHSDRKILIVQKRIGEPYVSR